MLTAVLLAIGAEFARSETPHPYVGMWVTADNRIRHELLPNGRYVEARGERERAYEGRYEINGTYIEYWDDSGFTADGEFVELDVLHHAGMVLYRK
ncbi:Atu4866 domain-containing protein [Roseovarius mucosus]|uniref:Atu4866 domain-containing protein n=1 Tax=Roseovarius mucosus TaxID=215743 RepID=UPI0035CFC310